jgi:hypothetical protein
LCPQQNNFNTAPDRDKGQHKKETSIYIARNLTVTPTAEAGAFQSGRAVDKGVLINPWARSPVYAKSLRWLRLGHPRDPAAGHVFRCKLRGRGVVYVLRRKMESRRIASIDSSSRARACGQRPSGDPAGRVRAETIDVPGP